MKTLQLKLQLRWECNPFCKIRLKMLKTRVFSAFLRLGDKGNKGLTNILELHKTIGNETYGLFLFANVPTGVLFLAIFMEKHRDESMPRCKEYDRVENQAILTSNAVVCGGMLAVINAACRTHTCKPGTRALKVIGLPFLFNIIAFIGTLNLMMEERLLLLMIVKLRFCLSTSTILPIAMLSGRGLPIMRITIAEACGGMLLVIAEDMVALIAIPVLKSETGILLPLSLNIRVFLSTTSLTVRSVLVQFTQSEYDTVIKVVPLSEEMLSITPFVILIVEFSEKKLSMVHLLMLYNNIFRNA